MNGSVRHRAPSPRARWRRLQLRADLSFLSNHFALASGDEAAEASARAFSGRKSHRLHTVPVTERDRLAALTRAAGLRLSREDLDALLPAWKRYRALVATLRAEMEPAPGDHSQ